MLIKRRNFSLALTAGTIFTASGLPSLSVFGANGPEPGLILEAGPEGRCDDGKIGGPVVVWNEDDQLWWMYYYCRSSDFPDAVAPAFGTGSIALAKSSDGIQWTRFDGPLKGGAIMVPSDDPEAFDSTHIGVGQIIRHKGEWIMAYFGGDSTLPTEIAGTAVHEGYQFKGYRCRPGFARSKDGINWTRIKGAGTGGAAINSDDAIYSAFPTVVADGDRFLLYYTALTPRMFYWQTRIATSTDLVNWEDGGTLNWSDGDAAWELSGMVTRNVQMNFLDDVDGKFLMIHTGLDGRYPSMLRLNGAAVSDDGINWRHLFDDPIFFPSPINRWDSGGVAYPNLVRVGDKLHLYYYGYAHPRNTFSPQRGIGLAISDNLDLSGLKRVVL